MSSVRCLRFAVLVLSVFGLIACNTMEGLGEDVEAVGEAVEDTARKHKEY